MVAITAGEMIPLLDDNGSGQYIRGRNSALDIRIGLLGMMALNSSADGFTPRVGVVPSHPAALKVLPQDTPDQTVKIVHGRSFVTRSGQGAYILSNASTQTVAMPAASAVNPRYDIVCIAAYDKGAFGGDAAHGPEFVVVSGTPAGSPSVPATPTDMLKLSDVFRGTNDNTISTSDITDKRVSTVVGGQIRTFFGGDATGGTGVPGEIRLNGVTNLVEIADATGTFQVFGAPLGTAEIGGEYKAAALQALTTGLNKLTFGTTVKAAAGITWNGTNQFTVVTPGWYGMSASLYMPGSSSMNCLIGTASASLNSGVHVHGNFSSTGLSAACGGSRFLTAGTTICAYSYLNSAGANTSFSTEPAEFQVWKGRS